MKLVRQCSEEQIKIGDKVVSFRGATAIVTGWDAPRHSASTGRVYVKETPEASEASYFPGVFGLEFVKE